MKLVPIEEAREPRYPTKPRRLEKLRRGAAAVGGAFVLFAAGCGGAAENQEPEVLPPPGVPRGPMIEVHETDGEPQPEEGHGQDQGQVVTPEEHEMRLGGTPPVVVEPSDEPEPEGEGNDG